MREEFFIFSLTFILINFKSVSPTAVVLPIDDYRMPCISFESALQIVKIRNSPPSLLEMSFKTDMDKAYRQRYGPTSHEQDKHAETYNCALRVEQEINNIIVKFLTKVDELLKLRRESFVSDGKNFEPKLQRTNRQISRPGSEGVDLDFESKDHHSESFNIRQIMSNVEDRLPFVYNETWLERRLQDDLSRGTDSTESDRMTDASKRRTKREPLSTIAILLSIASLTATTAGGLYLGARLEKLVDYVDELTNIVNNDWQNLKISVNDLTLLRNSFGSVCAGAQYLQKSMRQLVKNNLCHVQQARLLFELRDIANKLNGIYENFLHGTMSSDILPLSILKELFKQSDLERGLISAALPSTFYRGTSLSLLSVNKAKMSISLLFVAPRVEREAAFRQLKIHTVSSTIEIDDIIFDRVLDIDQKEFAMPIDLYDKKGENMNLTAADIHRLKIPLECTFTNGMYACRNFGTIGSDLSLCLEAIFAQKWSKIMNQCDVRLIPQNRHHVVSISHGATGLLISTMSRNRIFGEDIAKPLHYQKEDLTKMATRDNRGLCVWVSAHFSRILIYDDKNKLIETVNQDNRILVRNAHVEEITQFTSNHFAYYDRSAELPDGHTINFTGYYAEVLNNWKDINEVPRPHFHMKSHSNTFLIIAVTMATFILALYLIKMVKCIRRKRARPTVGDAEDAAARLQRVAIDDDQSPPETDRPTSNQSPPCKRRLNFDDIQDDQEPDRTVRKSVHTSEQPEGAACSELGGHVHFDPSKHPDVFYHTLEGDPRENDQRFILGRNSKPPPRKPQRKPQPLIAPRQNKELQAKGPEKKNICL